MENRCICCGDIIPEGRQVCPQCERKEAADDLDYSGCNLRRDSSCRGCVDCSRQAAMVPEKEVRTDAYNKD